MTWLSSSLKISREDATNVARQIMRMSRFSPLTRDADFEDKSTLYQLTQALILNAADPNSNLEFTEGGHAIQSTGDVSDSSQSHLSSQSSQMSHGIAPFSDALGYIVHLLELLLNVYQTHRLQIDMFGMMTCDA